MERITTDRLIIRAFEERDYEDLYEYLSDEEVVQFEPYTAMNEKEVRETLKYRIESGEFLAVEENSLGKVIGNIYIGNSYAEAKELGYVFNRKFWGKGYAFEACTAVCEKLFADGIPRLEANCDPNNPASWKLLERLGFVREGYLHRNIYFRKDVNGAPIWKDTCIYSRLASAAPGIAEKIEMLERKMWDAAKNRDPKAFLKLVREDAVFVCGGNRCSGTEYAEVISGFDCSSYELIGFEIVTESIDLIQVHYMIRTEVREEANRDLEGIFHVTSTWKRFGNDFRLVFNMDQRVAEGF